MYISNYGPSTHSQYLFALGRQDPGSKGRHHGDSILLGHLMITLLHSPELFEPAGGATGQREQQEWQPLFLPLLGEGELSILLLYIIILVYVQVSAYIQCLHIA